ncbi:NADPH:quinone reductase [Streptomyces luteolus]|uniref:NADPH:quinone reductase n=1 Tax=Streptomyces luteolus TaxID=3043615 RepID=A0ABT6T4U0_9ACTN|nr:NADPH:quinone reductase [Streptomyces sp. B-S-A12]MDI3422886.1 NADPH:quinone reductase [Streptomyces sp. B-S-A12]
MRAAYIEELGPPEGIRFGELPSPVPGPTDVLVDTLATTVNPVDTFVRKGVFSTPLPFPFVVSRDMVGRVAQAGPGAHGFAVGDLVWSNSLGHEGRQGAAAEQVVVAADRLYHLPEGVDPADAVAVAHPAGTAHLALFAHGRVRPGETVFVGGAAGNVGSALVAMAVDAGARVVATCNPRDMEYVRALGAAGVVGVVDYHDPQLAVKVRELTGGIGVDLHIDTFGDHDLERAVELIAPRGRIVLLAGVRSRPVLPAGPFFMKDASVLGFVISHASTGELAAAAVSINRLLAEKRLRPRVTETLPLSAAREAHQRMERGELRGKRLVLRTDLTTD